MPNSTIAQIHHHQSDDDHQPLSSDEINTFNCQSDKKISSRYTQLRKQLRSCEHFKENYFVLEVNKPCATNNAKSNVDLTAGKKKRKKKQDEMVITHPDESLSNDGGSEDMKKKRKKTKFEETTQQSEVSKFITITNISPSNSSSSNNSTTTSTLQNTTNTSSTTTCVHNNSESSISSSNTSNINTTTAATPQLGGGDGLILQLMGLLQNGTSTAQNCNNNNSVTLEGLELQIKLLQRLQDTINLLKGSNQPTIAYPTQEYICSSSNMNANRTSIPSSEDMFQQILDYGDCNENNQSFPVEMAGVASCEDFSELFNSFI